MEKGWSIPQLVHLAELVVKVNTTMKPQKSTQNAEIVRWERPHAIVSKHAILVPMESIKTKPLPEVIFVKCVVKACTLRTEMKGAKNARRARTRTMMLLDHTTAGIALEVVQHPTLGARVMNARVGTFRNNSLNLRSGLYHPSLGGVILSTLQNEKRGIDTLFSKGKGSYLMTLGIDMRYLEVRTCHMLILNFMMRDLMK